MVAAILGPIGFDGRTDDRGDGAFKGDEWRHNAAISDLSPRDRLALFVRLLDEPRDP